MPANNGFSSYDLQSYRESFGGLPAFSVAIVNAATIMRSARNFHPEWGYFAPTPSFARTLRVAVIAAAIGATAGSVVVVSLIGSSRSKAYDTSGPARALASNKMAVSAPGSELTKAAATMDDRAPPALAPPSPDLARSIEFAPARAAATPQPDVIPPRRSPIRAHRPRLAHGPKYPRTVRGFARSLQLPHNSGLVQFDQFCCAWTTPPARRNAFEW
jgi:hypothetical protein